MSCRRLSLASQLGSCLPCGNHGSHTSGGSVVWNRVSASVAVESNAGRTPTQASKPEGRMILVVTMNQG